MIHSASRREPRDGAAILGVWLIGLGLVFVIQQASGLTWREAWPLFVILFGVGSFASAILHRDRLSAGAWSLMWPVAWIVVGVTLVLATTGRIAVSTDDVARWWPAALIAVGGWFVVASIWPRPAVSNETLTLPLAGATSADVRIRFGGGELAVSLAAPDVLVSGTFEGGVEYTTNGPGSAELQPYSGRRTLWWDHPLRWDVALSGEIPLDLQLDTGANRSTIDLGRLRVRRLRLQTGMSETRLTLPAAGGTTSMEVRSGLAAVTIAVPAGVAARIYSRMALGSTTVDESRFPRMTDGYASPDFDSAPNRVGIDIQGGLGSVRVI